MINWKMTKMWMWRITLEIVPITEIALVHCLVVWRIDGGQLFKDGVIWGGQGFNPGREVEAHSEDTQDNLDNGNDKSEKRKW